MKEILKGALIGIANIIPGVSGGTFALILGIYDRLIAALNQRKDFFFLFKVGLGAIVAIFLLSSPLQYAMENLREAIYAFFLGLVVCSIPIPLKEIEKSERKKLPGIVAFLVAAAITVSISLLVNPVEKERVKSENLRQQLEEQSRQPLIDFNTGVMVFFSGAVAVSAMILPGISGSFVLLLTGQYETVINAVVYRDFILLGIFAAGCLAGLAFFCRILSWLFSRFRNITLSALTGLIAGSCAALWPFKTYVLADLYKEVDGEIMFIPQSLEYTQIPYIPGISGFEHGFGLSWLVIIALSFAAGVFIMKFFDKYS